MITIETPKLKLPEDENSELKELVTQNAVSGFLADDKLKDRLMKVLSVIAIPAFEGFKKTLGENDDFRFMIYFDKEHGIIIHKFKTETTVFECDEPSLEDIHIIRKEDISNVEELIKKITTSIGAKIF